MLETGGQEAVDVRRVTRRNFLKFCSALIGGVVLPHFLTGTLEPARAASSRAPFVPKPHFQWQNEFLCKTIYPMREQKLRDVLIYYMEVDVWAQYKGRDVNDLKDELYEYKRDWESNAAAAQQEYAWLRDYFLTMDVRGYYSNFFPIDEGELAEINNLHPACSIPELAEGYPWRAQFCARCNHLLGTAHQSHPRLDQIAHPQASGHGPCSS